MKHTIKSVIAVVLSLMLLTMLPISAAAEELSSLYNADYFVKLNETGSRTGVYPTYLYNGLKLPADSVVSITGANDTYEFTVDGGMGLGTNDVIDVTEKTTVTLSGNPVKYIGIIASGNTTGGSATFNILYESGNQECNVTLSAMNEAAVYNYEFGATLKKGTGLLPKFAEGDSTAYLNLVELSTDKKRNVTAIEFNPADFGYHVIAIVEIPYSQEELDSVFQETITAYLDIYKDKDLYDDLTEDDLANIGDLTDALLQGGEAYEADYERMNNLYIGYPLYNAQKELKADYDEIMNVKNYLEAVADDLQDSDETNLDSLIALYEKQAASDKEALQTAMDYFEMTDAIFVDEAEKETIEALKADYQVVKEKRAVDSQIKALYAQYADKTAEDLKDTDLTKLDELIAAYNRADELEVVYTAEEREEIEALKENYAKYQTSESNIHYDLSSYYNLGMIADEGDLVSDDWGSNNCIYITENDVKTGYKTGIQASKWNASHTNGIVKATTQINWSSSDVVHTPALVYDKTNNNKLTFKISTDTKSTDKNVVALDAGAITLNGSGRLAKTLDILSVGGQNNGNPKLSLTINFTDGTVQNQIITVVWNGYWGSSVSPSLGSYNARNLYNLNGVATEGNDNATVAFVFRAYSIPIEAGKIIDNVVITSGSTQGILVGVSEQVLTNEEYKALLKEQFNKVKDYTEETFDVAEATKFSQYCQEAEKRGLDIEDIIDAEAAEAITGKVLTAEGIFEKTDKDTVTATVKFSQAVEESVLKENLTVSKNNAEAEYTFTMKDDKTAVLTFDDSEKGGASYKISVSDALTLKEYPAYKISKAYEFSYTSPVYMEAVLSGNTLTVINNTKTDYKYVAFANEISADNTIIYTNEEYNATATNLSPNTHNFSIVGRGNLLISVWDENQKLIANAAGAATATEAQTVATADYMYPSLDFETNELKVSGFTPSKEEGKNITLNILKGTSSFIRKEALTNKDGYFEIVVPLNEYIIPSGTNLSFTLGGDDFSSKISLNDVYFSITTQREDVIRRLIDDASVIKEQTTKDILALDSQVYDNIDLDKAAAVISANKSLLSASDVTGSRENVRRLLILSAFNQGKKDIVSKDGLFTYEDVMNYSAIDNNGVTIYSLYKTAISDAGRALTVDSLLNQNFATIDALISQMTENMLVNEVEYPNVNGVGYVSDVLTQANADKVSLNIPKYFSLADKSAINAVITSAVITSKASIESTVNSFGGISYTPGGSTGSSSGGFSSGSSSVGSFGVEQNYLDNLTTQNNEANGATVFTDVKKDHWAYDYIMELYEKGILSGKGDGTFAPENSLTRAELVKVIVTAKGLTATDYNTPFTDVYSDSWYAPYVAAAYENGIVTGVTDTVFMPDEKVSRQDLCVVLYRLLDEKTTSEISFTDNISISDYALDAVKCFSGLGIVNGFEDGSFRPFESCTRAQCAKIISMFLQQ